MHWLPLVAMVIASALPFPHSPASRIAAATTEPGANSDRFKKDHYDSSGLLSAPTKPPVDYNALHKDYNMAAMPGRGATTQNHLTTGGFIQPHVSTALSSSKGESQKGSYRTDSNSASSTNAVGVDVTTETALGTSKCTVDSVAERDSTPQDYNPDSSGEKDHTRFGALRSPPERGPGGVDGRPALRVSVLDASSISPHGVHAQSHRGPEPSVPPEDATGAESSPAHRQEGKAEAEGGPAPPGGALEAVEESLGLGPGPVVDADALREGEDLFLDAHPRVLFSPSPSPPEHPPLLLMLETGMLPEEEAGEEEAGEGEEQEDGHAEGHGDRASDRRAPAHGRRPGPGRSRRAAAHSLDVRRGERSVCEAESVWVTDKKSATDSHGRTVTILPEIQTQTGPLKQYFYETRCRRAEQPRGGAAAGVATGVAGASCLGVDRKQWVSECKAKQSFVRALTKDANNRTGWRWIRIDSSCVCVLLSRVNRQWGERV